MGYEWAWLAQPGGLSRAVYSPMGPAPLFCSFLWVGPARRKKHLCHRHGPSKQPLKDFLFFIFNYAFLQHSLWQSRRIPIHTKKKEKEREKRKRNERKKNSNRAINMVSIYKQRQVYSLVASQEHLQRKKNCSLEA